MPRFTTCLAIFAVAASATHLLAQQFSPITNFGTVNIGSTATQTLTFTGMPAGVTLAQTLPSDFWAQSVCGANGCSVPLNCNGAGTCTVAVPFKPSQPGLRVDGIQIKDSQGHVLAVAP